MTPDDAHNALLLLGIACMMALAFLARYRRPECPECGHCRLRRQQELQRQRDVQHDYEHRIVGECRDPNCDRRPK